jgi:hypothetical protein
MVVHQPFGHADVREDPRDPRKTGPTSALEIMRRVRRQERRS